MSGEGGPAKHAEAPLSGGMKLVVIGAGGSVFIRLRAFRGGAWIFLTPPLPLTAGNIEGLTLDVGENVGSPVDLEHDRMDGKVNLLAYRGTLHVHFQTTQTTARLSELRAAVWSLIG